MSHVSPGKKAKFIWNSHLTGVSWILSHNLEEKGATVWELSKHSTEHQKQKTQWEGLCNEIQVCRWTGLHTARDFRNKATEPRLTTPPPLLSLIATCAFKRAQTEICKRKMYWLWIGIPITGCVSITIFHSTLLKYAIMYSPAAMNPALRERIINKW